MKNNRLTNTEIHQIKEAAKEIIRLAELKSASFKDMESVDIRTLKLWLQWFTCEATIISSIVDGKQS